MHHKLLEKFVGFAKFLDKSKITVIFVLGTSYRFKPKTWFRS